MENTRIDVSVLVVFFIRPTKLKEVFEQVKLARPSRLFLFQDGKRAGHPTDEANILACREIVSDIDWECDVKTNYSEFNYGVDSSVFAAIKWALEHTDKLIILEDDIVASQSFFRFAKEMLDKYEHDDAITMVGGMNHLGVYKPEESSYIFADSCAIWGWATWKRFVDMWDDEYRFIKNKAVLNQIKKSSKKRKFKTQYRKVLRVLKEKKQKKQKASFEASSFFTNVMSGASAIVPTKNLVTNIGIGEGTFHSADDIKKISTRMQKLFFMKRYELDYPLKHPAIKQQEKRYNKKVYRIMYPNLIVYVLTKLDSKIRRLFFR